MTARKNPITLEPTTHSRHEADYSASKLKQKIKDDKPEKFKLNIRDYLNKIAEDIGDIHRDHDYTLPTIDNGIIWEKGEIEIVGPSRGPALG